MQSLYKFYLLNFLCSLFIYFLYNTIISFLGFVVLNLCQTNILTFIIWSSTMIDSRKSNNGRNPTTNHSALWQHMAYIVATCLVTCVISLIFHCCLYCLNNADVWLLTTKQPHITPPRRSHCLVLHFLPSIFYFVTFSYSKLFS